MMLDDELRSRLECAVKAPDPNLSLRGLVMNLFRGGYSNEEVYEVFNEFLLYIRSSKQYDETDEDEVLDVMDALTGWCHPDVWLEFEED